MDKNGVGLGELSTVSLVIEATSLPCLSGLSHRGFYSSLSSYDGRLNWNKIMHLSHFHSLEGDSHAQVCHAVRFDHHAFFKRLSGRKPSADFDVFSTFGIHTM